LREGEASHEDFLRSGRKSLQLQWCRVLNILFGTVDRTTRLLDQQAGEVANGVVGDLVAIERTQVHLSDLDVDVGLVSNLPDSVVQKVLSAWCEVKVYLFHRAPRRRLMLVC